jgi:hypothetical protein
MSRAAPLEQFPTPLHTPLDGMGRKLMREVGDLGLPPLAEPSEPVAAGELEVLPAPARRLMEFMGVPGRPRDRSFRARWQGRFRMAPDKPWMPCEVWQYNLGAPVVRVFHMRVRLGGLLPTYVRDLYVNGSGRMLGKLMDTFSIVDDTSASVTTGELVTYVNDALMFAPSMLLGPATSWTPVDDRCFDVALTDHDTRVSARVFVNDGGAMTDFSTTDRFGEDPSNRRAGLVRTRWSTPVERWNATGERPLPAGGRAIWHFPGGDFCYAEISPAHMAIEHDVAPGGAPLD